MRWITHLLFLVVSLAMASASIADVGDGRALSYDLNIVPTKPCPVLLKRGTECYWMADQNTVVGLDSDPFIVPTCEGRVCALACYYRSATGGAETSVASFRIERLMQIGLEDEDAGTGNILAATGTTNMEYGLLGTSAATMSKCNELRPGKHFIKVVVAPPAGETPVIGIKVY